MKMTINLNEASYYIPSGRMSNIFKFLNLKKISFEENHFLGLEKNQKKNNFISEEKLFHITEEQINKFSKDKKREQQKYFDKLILNVIPKLMDKSKLEKYKFDQVIEDKKIEILKNKKVKEKFEKLKKLKKINDITIK